MFLFILETAIPGTPGSAKPRVPTTIGMAGLPKGWTGGGESGGCDAGLRPGSASPLRSHLFEVWVEEVWSLEVLLQTG
jgi:hypothetical protein